LNNSYISLYLCLFDAIFHKLYIKKLYGKFKDDIDIETRNVAGRGSFEIMNMILRKEDFEEMPWFKDDSKIFKKIESFAKAFSDIKF